jgi:hypothetical protein
MLLDHLMQDPDDREARRQLTAMVAERQAVPHRTGLSLLGLVAVVCAMLSMVCLLSDMDVTAALLAVAGIYTVWIMRRRR